MSGFGWSRPFFAPWSFLFGAEPYSGMSSDANTERGLLHRIAQILMIGGALGAVVGVGAWVFDVIPAMPAWMLRIAVYKLTIGAGVGMLFVGAAIRRTLRTTAGTLASGERTHLLEGGRESPRAVGRTREPDPVRRPGEHAE